MDKLGSLAALGKLWHDLSPSQRMLAVAFVVLSVAVVGFAAIIASKPRMSVLFSGLETEDAGAIAQKLDEEKVAYQLSGDGRTIEVPANQAYDLRLKMATQGLPQGGTVGFEQFDKGSFGMTEFTERVTYQRALQGELTRTICQLAPVVSARVAIVLPEEKVYASEQTEPKASIFLKLRRGDPLTDEQVGGIVHLVSSAVEGLKPSSVTVVDSQGNVLSDSYGDGAAAGGMSMTQAKMKRQYENELAANLQSMLARIVGADKAVVRVSAELDFDRRELTSESYEPAKGQEPAPTTEGGAPQVRGILASEESTTETYKGKVNPPADAPNAGPGNDYQLNRSNAQYQVSKQTLETVTAPGKVSRLCVAVLVDKSVAGNRIGAIREAVTAAAGIDPARKDQVTVQSVAFESTTKKSMENEMAGAERSEMIMGIAKTAGAIVLLLLFLFFLRSIVRQIRVQAPTSPVISPFVGSSTPGGTMPSNPIEMMRQVSEADSGTAPQSPAKRAPQSNLPPEITQSSPEDLARLVKAWMADGPTEG